MPKHPSTSLRSLDNKENYVPVSSSSNRRRRDVEDEEEGLRIQKRERGTKAKERYGSSSSANGLQSSYEADGKALKKQDRAFKSSSSSLERVRKGREDALEHDGQQENGHPARSRGKDEIRQELEDVQAQFDELRELRVTVPERMLADWKTDADRSARATEEYIATLKKQIDERHATTGREDLSTLRAQLKATQARESKLQEENVRQARELEAFRRQASQSTSSMATRAGIGSGHMLGAGDERAVRRLYEDLTGIVVNKVEQIDSREPFRRFHAIFACSGYHDLEIKLDESTSDLPSSVPSNSNAGGQREDLVYTPTLDDDRDAELLESGKLPAFLKDSIRFERATAVKFLSTLHKRLDRHSKR